MVKGQTKALVMLLNDEDAKAFALRDEVRALDLVVLSTGLHIFMDWPPATPDGLVEAVAMALMQAFRTGVVGRVTIEVEEVARGCVKCLVASVSGGKLRAGGLRPSAAPTASDPTVSDARDQALAGLLRAINNPNASGDRIKALAAVAGVQT